MLNNNLRNEMFSEQTKHIARSILKRKQRPYKDSEGNAIERYDVLKSVHEAEQQEEQKHSEDASVVESGATEDKFIGFKDFNREHKTPNWLVGWHNIACDEQYEIIMNKLEGIELLEYERQLMLDKSNSYIFNESLVKDAEQGHIKLDRVKNMALNAASGSSDMSARILTYYSLETLFEGMRHKQSRNAFMAVGAKKFLDAIKQLSSIQNMVKELIRMNKKDDDSKNMVAVQKLRKARNKGDLEGLADQIARTLAFNLSGSIKEL